MILKTWGDEGPPALLSTRSPTCLTHNLGIVIQYWLLSLTWAVLHSEFRWQSFECISETFWQVYANTCSGEFLLQLKKKSQSSLLCLCLLWLLDQKLEKWTWDYDCGCEKLWSVCFCYHCFPSFSNWVISLIDTLVPPFSTIGVNRSQSILHSVSCQSHWLQHMGSWATRMHWFEAGAWSDVEEKERVTECLSFGWDLPSRVLTLLSNDQLLVKAEWASVASEINLKQKVERSDRHSRWDFVRVHWKFQWNELSPGDVAWNIRSICTSPLQLLLRFTCMTLISYILFLILQNDSQW